jgi:hypothetical protein
VRTTVFFSDENGNGEDADGNVLTDDPDMQRSFDVSVRPTAGTIGTLSFDRRNYTADISAVVTYDGRGNTSEAGLASVNATVWRVSTTTANDSQVMTVSLSNTRTTGGGFYTGIFRSRPIDLTTDLTCKPNDMLVAKCGTEVVVAWVY